MEATALPPSTTGRLDSWVFPIGMGEQVEGGVVWKGLVGTGFPISTDGWCLTAGHVLSELPSKPFATFPLDSAFRAYDITDVEMHPREDLAIFRVLDRPLTPLCGWMGGMCHAPRDFTAMGYPASLLKDHGRRMGPDGSVPDRPELLVAKGHIRRRYDFRLPGFRGTSLAEMSEWLGEGSSGGPVIDRTTPYLLGLYLGYRPEKMTTEEGPNQPAGARGVMLRIDDCVDWEPQGLGYRSLRDVLTVANKSA